MFARLNTYQVTGDPKTWERIELGSRVEFVNIKQRLQFTVQSIHFAGSSYNSIKSVFANMQEFDSVRDCRITTTTGIKIPLNRLTYVNTSTI
jgi:hypothetical protein